MQYLNLYRLQVFLFGSDKFFFEKELVIKPEPHPNKKFETQKPTRHHSTRFRVRVPDAGGLWERVVSCILKLLLEIKITLTPAQKSKKPPKTNF